MHWLDTVILCILAVGAIWGAFVGILWQMFWILAPTLSLCCSIVFNPMASMFVHRHLMADSSEFSAHIAAYVLVFVIVFLMVLGVALAAGSAVKRIKLQWLNRMLGSLFGMAKLVLVMGVILLGLSNFSVFRNTLEGSSIAPVLVEGMQRVLAAVPEEYRQASPDEAGGKLQEELKNALPKELRQHLSPELRTSPSSEKSTTPDIDEIIDDLKRSKE